MTRFMTQLERPRATVSAYGYATLSARLAHLRYMSAPHDKPLDRTPMWTLDEFCTVLLTTPATVYTWRKHGQGPRAYKVGRHLLFADADVRAWLKSCVSDPERGDDEATPEDRTTGSGWCAVGRTELEPGEHGSISIKQTGPRTWRARTSLKLMTGD